VRSKLARTRGFESRSEHAFIAVSVFCVEVVGGGVRSPVQDQDS
jgi:hypothetical protein